MCLVQVGQAYGDDPRAHLPVFESPFEDIKSLLDDWASSARDAYVVLQNNVRRAAEAEPLSEEVPILDSVTLALFGVYLGYKRSVMSDSWQRAGALYQLWLVSNFFIYGRNESHGQGGHMSAEDEPQSDEPLSDSSQGHDDSDGPSVEDGAGPNNADEGDSGSTDADAAESSSAAADMRTGAAASPVGSRPGDIHALVQSAAVAAQAAEANVSGAVGVVVPAARPSTASGRKLIRAETWLGQRTWGQDILMIIVTQAAVIIRRDEGKKLKMDKPFITGVIKWYNQRSLEWDLDAVQFDTSGHKWQTKTLCDRILATWTTTWRTRMLTLNKGITVNPDRAARGKDPQAPVSWGDGDRLVALLKIKKDKKKTRLAWLTWAAYVISRNRTVIPKENNSKKRGRPAKGTASDAEVTAEKAEKKRKKLKAQADRFPSRGSTSRSSNSVAQAVASQLQAQTQAAIQSAEEKADRQHKEMMDMLRLIGTSMATLAQRAAPSHPQYATQGLYAGGYRDQYAGVGTSAHMTPPGTGFYGGVPSVPVTPPVRRRLCAEVQLVDTPTLPHGSRASAQRSSDGTENG
jgi:hypothetical protein